MRLKLAHIPRPEATAALASLAVSVLLLGGTSIFVQMVAATRALRVGYAIQGVVMLETDLRFAGYSEDTGKSKFDELLRRIKGIPGVESAALLRGLPMDVNSTSIVVDGAAGQTGTALEAVSIAAGP